MRWYRQAKGHPIPPNKEGLEHTSTLRDNLYRRRPIEGKAIPILVQPQKIADYTMEGGEITVAVRRVQMGRVGGLSAMRSEHLKVWLREVTL